MSPRTPSIDYAPETAVRPVAVDRFLFGRGGVLAATALATALIVLMLAGSRWPVVVWELLTDGGILSLWLLSAVGWGAYPVKCLALPFEKHEDDGGPPAPSIPWSLALVTAAALGFGLIGFLVLGLGLAGWLNGPVAWVIVFCGIALLATYVARRRGGTRGRFDRLNDAMRVPAGSEWLWVLVSPILAALLLSALVPPGFLWGMGEPNGYDVLAYHLQVPREWCELGRIAPLTHNVFSYFPMGVEVHYLLAMHLTGGPWEGMFLAQLMHAAMTSLTVLAVYAFAIPRGRLTATLAGLSCAAVPWLTLAGSIAYDEGGLLLFGTLAVVWSLGGNEQLLMKHAGYEIGEGDPPPAPFPTIVMRHLILAGLLAGLAGGAKLTGVPLFLVGLPIAVLSTTRRPDLSRAVGGLALFVVAGLLVLSPWLARNVVWTGNPVFPEATSLFGKAHFSQTQVERWKRAHSPPEDKRSIVARVGEFKNQVLLDDRFAYVLIPFGVVALLLVRGRVAGVLGVMLAVIVVFWIGFTHLQGRFFMPAVPILALGIGLVRGKGYALALIVPTVALLVVGSVSLQQRADAQSGQLRRNAGIRLSDVIGIAEIDSAKQEMLANLPDDATLGLVGDAGAFMYRRPTARLRYRSVFDVDAKPGEDPIAAWSRDWPMGTALLVSPGELDRFSKTYVGIPPLPNDFPRGPTLLKKR